MKNYILSIVVCGIVSSITCALFDEKNSTGKVVRILAGILMTVTLLAPVKTFSFNRVLKYFDDLSINASTYTEEGKNTAQTKIDDIIKERAEAYILDKAKSMGLDVAVEVELNDNNSVPCGIMITGKVAPYEKGVLRNYIEENLGISKENQQWI